MTAKSYCGLPVFFLARSFSYL